MGRQMQNYGFEESAYERPTQDWICGWSAEGRPCHMGPDKNGRCNTTHECAPYRKGDRWHCSRPKYLGGKCKDGPLPDGVCCMPVLKCSPLCSLRVNRGKFVYWLLALITGLLIIVFTSSFRNTFISPGNLTSQHSMIGDDCSVCHSATSEGLSHWFQNINKSNVGTKDSMLCLKCHNQVENNLLAHGLTSEETEKLTENTRQKSFKGRTPFLLSIAQLGPEVPKGPNGELACSTCHHEHNGRGHNLIEMSNQQCQICHSIKFEKFSKGHQEFDDYPYRRRTRLMFDHVSHQKQHFKEAGKYFNCRECHVTDESGAYMLVNGYDTSCAGCHSEVFKGGQSIIVFNLPGLDVETLRERNVPIGEWPEGAEDGLTPFMRFLLSGDPQTANDIEGLSKLDLLDLTDAGKEELDMVCRYVWAIKGLFHDLRMNGQLAFKSRFEKATGRTFKNHEIANLITQLSPETIKHAQMAWLPNLATEMNRRQAGEAVFPPGMDVNEAALQVSLEEQQTSKVQENDDVRDKGDAGQDDILGDGNILIEDGADDILEEGNIESGYILEEDERSANMESDDILHEGNIESGYILEEDERLANMVSDDILGEANIESGYILEEDERLANMVSDDILGEANIESGYILEEDERMANMESDDILNESNIELDDILDEGVKTANEEADDILGEDDIESDDILGDNNGLDDILGETLESSDEILTDDAGLADATDIKAPPVQTIAEVKAGEWVYTGGWFLRDYDFSIHYLPVEHANKFLKSWIDLSARGQAKAGSGAVNRLFAKLTADNTPGRCTKCHSIDEQSTGQFQVNWHSYRPKSCDNRFTRYAHKPHLSLDDKEICNTCHVINYGANYSESFNDNDPGTFASNFSQMSKPHCATCHSKHEVGQSCLTCHNYHVGKYVHDAINTSLAVTSQ